VYEYLRLLFARIGKTLSPVSGEVVVRHEAGDVLRWVMTFPEGTRFAVCAPVVLPEGRTLEEQLEIFRKEGYARVFVERELCALEELIGRDEMPDVAVVELAVDRLVVSSAKTFPGRLADSVETAFFEGHGACLIRMYTDGGVTEKVFSKRFEADGMTFEEPSDVMFSFNSPAGACPKCEGFGRVLGISEDLVIPDRTRSVYDGAVACWRGEVLGEWLRVFIRQSALFDFPIHRPYELLAEEEKNLLWHGGKRLRGIDDFFAFVEENQYKIQYRVIQARYRGRTVCPACRGTRLKPQALYVMVGGKHIAELAASPVRELLAFFEELDLNATDAAIGGRLLLEIKNRLSYLRDVGLGYLTLDRLSSTLSGGESQRINLATSLGSSLVGSLYVLDEPSIGLHPRDTHLLIGVLRRLQSLGNTVVVVEHDEEIIRSADYIVDIGPGAGRLGGRVVYQGPVNDIRSRPDSHTVRYLTGEERIDVPPYRRLWNNYIEVKGAHRNNLKGIDVRFPLGVMTVVTGVSGSGKSTLMHDLFYTGILRRLEGSTGFIPAGCRGLEGDVFLIEGIEFIDQHAIGKSSRSNPVTYTGAYDEIRKLYGDLPLSRQMGFTSASFSFNKEGGRCEECKGEGRIVIEMQFMADITLTCEACRGKRFKPDLLEVEYREANIHDVLEMTVNQALEFFGEGKTGDVRKILRRLTPLKDVGLGYIKLGQTSSTLSGGENQRVKLAYYLGQEKQRPTLFVFDEPTTGLHFHDIRTLLGAFDALLEKGHTLIIIEHNMEVIKCADHIIDLGPDGGDAGGHLVCAGTPEDVARCPASHTGRFLREKLGLDPGIQTV
jgi:excinuclease ABC subunit A